MRRVLVFGVVVSILSACGGGSGASQDSGIRGEATLGPTCPVVTEDTECLPKPYEADIRVASAEDGELVTTVRSGKDGRFEAFLEPGSYVLEGVSTAESFPYAKPVTVTVRTGEFARATLAFDSGIR